MKKLGSIRRKKYKGRKADRGRGAEGEGINIFILLDL